MIDFQRIELNKESLRLKYLTAKPFPHLVIQDVCDELKLNNLFEQIPELTNKSRDFVFAKNKIGIFSVAGNGKHI